MRLERDFTVRKNDGPMASDVRLMVGFKNTGKLAAYFYILGRVTRASAPATFQSHFFLIDRHVAQFRAIEERPAAASGVGWVPAIHLSFAVDSLCCELRFKLCAYTLCAPYRPEGGTTSHVGDAPRYVLRSRAVQKEGAATDEILQCSRPLPTGIP